MSIEDMMTMPKQELARQLHQMSLFAHEQRLKVDRWESIAKALYTSIVDPDDPIFGCQQCALKSYRHATEGNTDVNAR
jgi:hypothetical protein